MVKVTRRLGRLSGAIAAGVAIIATGSGVMAASYSTFSATAPNAGNTWTSGTLTLAHDATGAMFTADPTVQSGSKCIKVSSGGSYSGLVKLYSTSFVNAGALAERVNLTIEVGPAAGPGAFAGCAGFSGNYTVFTGTLKAFDTAHSSYANGAATGSAGWNTTAGTPEYRVFKFSWNYDSTSSVPVPQGVTTSDTFTWEAQTS